MNVLLAVLGAMGLLHGQDLRGVIDIHVHSDPDSIPRSIDAVDAAKLARDRGMRAIVLKNHYEPTASLAYIVHKLVPGIEVFGGIALNRTVGGINSAAVERMTQVKGGLGRVVWMPTFDSENQVRKNREDRAFVSVSRDGGLLPEVEDVIGVIAKHDLVLATGHSTPAEDLMLIREAKARGVRRIVVTHAMLAPVSMSVGQMKEAASMGAWIEFVGNSVIGKTASVPMKDFAAAIRAVGPEHCIISSDLGQAGNPLHPDGLLQVVAKLREDGIETAAIERMTKANPAQLLGLK